MSLGHSVVFQYRRAPCEVSSSIRLEHGDILVMCGLAQLEYEHRTASGLLGPRVNLTNRWVAQHTASCPLAGVVGCVLPSCVQCKAEPDSRWLWEEGENKWISFWELVLLLLIVVSVLLVSTLIHNRRRHRHSGQRLSCSAVHFPSRVPARWVGRRRWRLSRRCQSLKRRYFIPPLVFSGRQNYAFFRSMEYASS